MRDLLTKVIVDIKWLKVRLASHWVSDPMLGCIERDMTELEVTRDSMPAQPEPEQTFEQKLASAVNGDCRENESDTPDFILAGFMNKVLGAYEFTVRERERWYGRTLGGGRSITVSERDEVGGVASVRTVTINEAAHGHEA